MKKDETRQAEGLQSNTAVTGITEENDTIKKRIPLGVFIKYDPVIARKFGIDAALIMGLIHFRSRVHASDTEGLWVRLTQADISEWVPRTVKSISNTVGLLIDAEILSRRQRHSANRTYEYLINYSILGSVCPGNSLSADSCGKSFRLETVQQGASKQKSSSSANRTPNRLEEEVSTVSYIKEVDQEYYLEDKELLDSFLKEV